MTEKTTIDITEGMEVAPAAKPPSPEQEQAMIGGNNTMPMPVGKPMQVGSPTPGERTQLEAAGWKDGEAIPENFAEIQEWALGQATDQSAMPPPGDLNTPPLQMPEETAFEDLSPEQQAKYQQVMKSVVKGSNDEQLLSDDLNSMTQSGVNQSIVDAVRQARGDAPTVVDDRESEDYDHGAPKHVPEKDTEVDLDKKDFTEEEVQKAMCSRCGFPKHEEEPIIVTDRDKDNYVQSILGDNVFAKQYPLFAGKLVVTIRSLCTAEVDQIYRQMSELSKNGTINSRGDEMETLNRFRCCLQVQSVQSTSKNFTAPASLDAWPSQNLQEVWKQFQKVVVNNESTHRVISEAVADFNSVMSKLEVHSRMPDFWQAVAQQD
jgi:hypothetical protein